MPVLIRGKLQTGFGLAQSSLAAIHETIERRSGLKLVVGTLNVRLERPYIVIPEIGIDGSKHEYPESLLIQRCSLFSLPGLIVRTNTQAAGESHGLDIVEVMTIEHLRTSRGLRDGDLVELRVGHLV